MALSIKTESEEVGATAEVKHVASSTQAWRGRQETETPVGMLANTLVKGGQAGVAESAGQMRQRQIRAGISRREGRILPPRALLRSRAGTCCRNFALFGSPFTSCAELRERGGPYCRRARTLQ